MLLLLLDVYLGLEPLGDIVTLYLILEGMSRSFPKQLYHLTFSSTFPKVFQDSDLPTSLPALVIP
jgi:hypothetical protein